MALGNPRRTPQAPLARSRKGLQANGTAMRSESLKIALTTDEKRVIVTEARRSGLSAADWLRMLGLRAAEREAS